MNIKKELSKYLSKKDMVDLLELSHQILTCRDEAELASLVLDLKQLFYFEHALSAHGNLSKFLEINRKIPEFKIWNINYSSEYLQEYMTNQLYYNDIHLCEFINTLSPVSWLESFKKHGFDYPSAQLSFDYNMNDGWVYGVLDRASMNCNVFYFSGPFTDGNQRVKAILACVIPFLSEAYKRSLVRSYSNCPQLTKRETEILTWIKEGKSSWEISMIQNCSKRTVEFHTNNIKMKLNAVNRAQATVIALHEGIISF